MAAPSPEFVEYVLEQLDAIAGITSGRLFGGVGFSLGGVQFAMIIEGSLYFVVDDATRPKYEALGSTCFAYETKKRRVDVRRYFEVPADIIEDKATLTIWAEEAIFIAQQTGRKKRRA